MSTTPTLLDRAMQRLDEVNVVLEYNTADAPVITKPLAALLWDLRNVGDPACEFDSVAAHRSLILLLTAIMGDK